MSKKILIVDDSALMRRVISDIIKSQNEYEVADIARDGLEGFEKITANPLRYDAIVMDINMPKMNGLEVLENLQKYHVKHTTIVVSTVAIEGARETIRALELGAFDFVTKPTSYAEVSGADFRDRLLEMLKLAVGLNDTKPEQETQTAKAAPPIQEKRSDRPPAVHTEPARRVHTEPAPKGHGDKLIALACSTGGPKSLQSVIPYLPEDLDAPMVMVQHMPKGFTLSLAQRLDELSKIKVSEAVDGEILEKGHVYIAPGGQHMEIVRTQGNAHRIRLTDDPPIDALRPCANVMYNSLTDSGYSEIVCVVLTGMGADGTKGITGLASKKKVHVIAQDKDTSVVYGMPKAIAEAGLTDEVKPLEEIANTIIRSVGVS